MNGSILNPLIASLLLILREYLNADVFLRVYFWVACILIIVELQLQQVQDITVISNWQVRFVSIGSCISKFQSQ